MKMKDDHYAYMESKLDETLFKADISLNQLKAATGWNDDKLGWHLLKKSIPSNWQSDDPFFPVYDYLNDDHIKLALKQYFKERE